MHSTKEINRAVGMPFLVASNGGLKRALSTRHLLTFAIFGVAFGYIIPSNTTLLRLGPLSVLLGYVISGTVLYAFLVSLGEMISLLPLIGGPIHLAQRFVDPAFGFMLGWTWWYVWTVSFASALVSAPSLVFFWDPVTPWAWITIAWFIAFAINMFGVKTFGETQFSVGMLRFVFAFILIIVGLVIDLGGAPNHDRIGFRYWKDRPPVIEYAGSSIGIGRLASIWINISQTLLAFTLSEITAITAPEVKNPQQSIPFVIKRVYPALFFFYLIGIFISTLINPPVIFLNSSSPFIIAASVAGLRGLPSVINAVFIMVQLSTMSLNLYMASRGLHAMGCLGFAPRIFGNTLRNGTPHAAVIFTSLFGAFAYMAITARSASAFSWIVLTTSAPSYLILVGILVTYLRFYSGTKAQSLTRENFPMFSRLQPYAAWYALVFSLLVAVFFEFPFLLNSPWDTVTFVTTYLAFPSMLVLYAGAKFWFRAPFVRAKDMDFVTGTEGFKGDDDLEALRMNDIDKK
ncbi:hypothetical protein SISSUDRAFT_1021229 [Sistotremastrum suecicum HHB10207 ss-3]|uniref:Amino acid permease/ SLC12A domain-containing protein n=1 Tax=Sistotremastrum suecicum HHB10207 ss-3 TaxID=1314776 RepID=A0A166DLK9_9AGAM|nr:hypothetical protein SISSUDRAFT_1021229 [Sistotremastrum suecicum HHB10207 ss-3]